MQNIVIFVFEQKGNHMTKHLNVIVKESDLQEFISKIDENSDWNIVDIEERSSFHFIYHRVLTWNVLLEYEYSTEDELANADLDYEE